MGHQHMTKHVIKTDEVEEIVQSLDMVAGRRAFMQALGYSAVGAAVFGAAAGVTTPAAAAVSDFDILNFALNLEYLESTFYHYAYYGTDIPATVTKGSQGEADGGLAVGGTGSKVPFKNNLVKAYAAEIANEELRHVEFLRAGIAKFGGQFVARPQLNVGNAFQAAATAAGIPGAFNAYTNDTTFLIASYIFEDVGVTAYHGAASLIASPAVLNYAAGILAVEAYHAGIIRTSMFAQDVASGTTTFGGITAQISALRSKLANMGAAGVDDVGIGSLTAPTIVDVDAPAATMFIEIPGGDAIAYARSASPQVLNIVYGNANTTPGLFFPNGMNGTIR